MRVRGDISGLDELENRIEEHYVQRLIEAGEAACQKAVIKGWYQNITGNLRSSIGYVIGYDGKVIKVGGFHKVQGRGENYKHVTFTTRNGKKVDFLAKGKYGDGSEGSKKGLELARSIISKTRGYSYVIVAGMEYASYVNSKGYDVMDSAKLEIKKMIG